MNSAENRGVDVCLGYFWMPRMFMLQYLIVLGCDVYAGR